MMTLTLYIEFDKYNVGIATTRSIYPAGRVTKEICTVNVYQYGIMGRGAIGSTRLLCL